MRLKGLNTDYFSHVRLVFVNITGIQVKPGLAEKFTEDFKRGTAMRLPAALKHLNNANIFKEGCKTKISQELSLELLPGHCKV